MTDHPGAAVELTPADLYRPCELSAPFATTAELEDLDVAIGQERALAALELAVGMRGDGYNLFVLGRSGSQRRRITETFLRTDAIKTRGEPADWCYLNNFDDERKPIAVRLPRGKGAELRHDLAQLVDELRSVIPGVFESERYRNSVAEITQEFEERQHTAFDKLQEEAKRSGLSLITTPHGFALAPVRNGKVMAPQEFDQLPEIEREQTARLIDALSDKLRQHIEQLPRWHKEHHDRVAALDRETTETAAGQLISQLQAKYSAFPELVRHFDALRSDVLRNAASFLPSDESSPLEGAHKQPLVRYEVNLLVDHAASGEAPIVYEGNPSIHNLLGRIEHTAQFGALFTNFTMIRAGALHRANGGYLILDADRLIREPLAWPALKRALFGREVKIESLGELAGLVSTISIEPSPVPLDIKVILIGDRELYYLLAELDPDFGELFKVAADFENRIARTPENTDLYARMIATLARREGLAPLSRDAVARVIEHSARLLGDSQKLTTRLRDIADLLREADYWSRRDGNPATERGHVQLAIDAQIRRLDRVRAETQEGIARHLLLIDTAGEKIGQVNGLSVLGIGNFAFGQPARITASVRIGNGEIIDIERESELGGRIHSKGVLILSAYLASKYATDTPLSLAASLVFEQSYGGVEGDSASIAETCALLSALSGLPIRQWLAVTGSVNQHGQAQVIGGVNEKIEGFFDTCSARGLDGRQGVVIPRDNVPHLMLRADVVDAVRAGTFHVYAIGSIDDAVTLLTGIEAGARDARGRFPTGTVNHRVERRVRELARNRRRFARALPGPRRKTDRGSAKRAARRPP